MFCSVCPDWLQFPELVTVTGTAHVTLLHSMFAGCVLLMRRLEHLLSLYVVSLQFASTKSCRRLASCGRAHRDAPRPVLCVGVTRSRARFLPGAALLPSHSQNFSVSFPSHSLVQRGCKNCDLERDSPSPAAGREIQALGTPGGFLHSRESLARCSLALDDAATSLC